MHFDYDDYRCFIAALTTSRRIDAAPHDLARALRHPRLFTPSLADRQQPHPITIDLDPVPEGRGAVTLHCPKSGISERHSLRTRHLSSWRLTAETGDDEAVRDVRRAHTFTLTVDLIPLLRPGPAIATRVILSFRFVCEPWWPHDIACALGSLADIWLRRMEELATA